MDLNGRPSHCDFDLLHRPTLKEGICPGFGWKGSRVAQMSSCTDCLQSAIVIYQPSCPGVGSIGSGLFWRGFPDFARLLPRPLAEIHDNAVLPPSLSSA